jgi:hypothetical protein
VFFTQKALTVVILVSIATALAFVRLGSPITGIDDADIFLVYARSVSAGEGFVFNPGSERVEGFTSLFWVLICSLAIAIAGDPERWLLGVNLLFVSITIGCCLRFFVLRDSVTNRRTSLPWAAAFVILLLLDFRFIAWNTVTLMETGLWTALVTAAATFAIGAGPTGRHTSGLAVLFALLVLTRPEALVWVPALCAVFYTGRAASAQRADAVGAVAAAALAFAVTAALLTIFRILYFGVPLPNTYYAKVSPSLSYSVTEGVKYLQRYLLSGPVPIVCGLSVLLSVVHLLIVRFRDLRTLALTMLALVGLAIPVLTGGDHFDGFRFYQPVYPLLLLALLNFARFIVPAYVGASITQSPRTVRVAATAALFAIIVTIQLFEWTAFDSFGLRNEFDIAAAGRQQGHRINLLFGDRPLPDIGAISVGGLKYGYDGHVIDLMGLNHTKMAHNGGDRVGLRSHAAFERGTFYELHPTIVMPLPQYSADLGSAEQRIPFVDMALKGLMQEVRFRSLYALAEVRKTTPRGTAALSAWYDRKFLGDLARSGEFNIRFADERAHR